MTTAISKDMLKAALIELSQSDREFFVDLLADAFFARQPKAQTQNGQKKRANSKINPPYRKDVEALSRKYAIDKSAILELRGVLADAPPSEEIVRTLRK